VPSADGAHILLVDNRSVRVLDVRGGGERELVRAEAQPQVAIFSPDQRLVAVGGDDRIARVVTFASGERIVESRFSGRVFTAAFSEDGRWVAFGTEDGTVRVFDISTRRLWAEMRPGLGVISKLAFPRGNQWIAIQANRGVVVYLLDPFERLCGLHGRNPTNEEWRSVGAAGAAPTTCKGWR
jgi:WD40 repeat protein